MSRYDIGKAVPIEVTIERPRRGGKAHTETWDLAINQPKDMFGLAHRDPKVISHMSYGLDYVEPLRWLAENDKDAWWYFDAGTSMPAIKVAATDLLAAFIALEVLLPPFRVKFHDSGEVIKDDDLYNLLAKADEVDSREDELITIYDATGWTHDGHITKDD